MPTALTVRGRLDEDARHALTPGQADRIATGAPGPDGGRETLLLGVDRWHPLECAEDLAAYEEAKRRGFVVTNLRPAPGRRCGRTRFYDPVSEAFWLWCCGAGRPWIRVRAEGGFWTVFADFAPVRFELTVTYRRPWLFEPLEVVVRDGTKAEPVAASLVDLWRRTKPTAAGMRSLRTWAHATLTGL